MAVTRNDVAREAGVSPAVVSYVINGGPRPVSARARSRVEAAIKRLDYRPDPVAGALRGGRSRMLGVLTPSLTNPFFAELVSALETQAFGLEHSLTIASVGDGPQRTRTQLVSLSSRRIDGLLLLDFDAAPTVAEFGWPGPQCVLLDQPGGDFGFSAVHLDNFASAVSAVEYLQQLGHREIGCIAGPRSNPASADRIAGWRAQLKQGGVVPGEDLIARVEWTEAGGAAAAMTLLGPDGRPLAFRRSRPSALLVNSDVQAIGVLMTCHQLGLRVPDDVSIMSIDGTRLASFSTPRLTSIRHPYEAIAQAAIERLLASADGAALSDRALKGNVVVGETVGMAR